MSDKLKFGLLKYYDYEGLGWYEIFDSYEQALECLNELDDYERLSIEAIALIIDDFAGGDK